ncbi:MAG: hypothetical protein FJ276_22820 [Planctomycetes bacterium]|nr:hypothetical protein [Planctomycetota bacterium]
MSRKAQDTRQLPIFRETERAAAEGLAESSAQHGLFYVTNASNLRSTLAAGLIRPREGWPKYAPDFQERTPGYIPLFCGGVPHSQIVEQVTKHDCHDLPVIVEFDGTSWTALNIPCVMADGERDNVDFPKLPQSARMLLLRGVIPLAEIRKVYFSSRAAAERFTSDCQAFSNTRAAVLVINDDFSVVPDIRLPPVVTAAGSIPIGQPDYETSVMMRRVDAVGGVLAALVRVSNTGGESLVHDVFPEAQTVQSETITPNTTFPEQLALTVTHWIRAEKFHIGETMCAVLSCILDFLANPAAATGFAAESLLGAIEQHAQDIREKDQRLLVERLQTIRSSVLHDESPAPFFHSKGSPVLRGLLLFLLDSEYRRDRVLPRGCTAAPQDLLIAEIMRGALNGWSRVPVVMRGSPEAEFAVGFAMARLHNRMPGAARFRSRADHSATVAAILQEVIRIVRYGKTSEELRQMVIDEHARELDVHVRSKRMKGASQPVLEHDLKKKGKKITLTFTVALPWE